MKELVKNDYEGAVKQYKVVQKKNEFTFFLVRGVNYNPKVEEYIIQRMYSEISNEITIVFKFVEEIERESIRPGMSILSSTEECCKLRAKIVYEPTRKKSQDG